MSVNYRNVEKLLVKWTKKVKPKIHRQVDAAVDGCKNRILDRLRAQMSTPPDQEGQSDDQSQTQIQQILNEASDEFQIQLADAVAVCFGDVQKICQNELAKAENNGSQGLLEQAIAEAQINDEPIENDGGQDLGLLDDNNANDDFDSDVEYVCEVAATYSTDDEATENEAEAEEDLAVVSKPSTSTRTRSSSKKAAANKENAAKKSNNSRAKKKGKEPKAKAVAKPKEAKTPKSKRKEPKDGTSTKRKTPAKTTTPKRKKSTKNPQRKSRAKRTNSDDDDGDDTSTPRTPRKRRRLDATLEEDSAHQYRIINVSLRCTEPKCDIVCENKELLLAHLKRTHKIEKHRCMFAGCSESFINTVELGEHLDTAHPVGGPWPCGICGASFTASYTHLVSHHFKLHEPGHFTCSAENCTFESVTFRSEVQNHQKREHRFGFTCGVCEKGFSSNIDLQRHQLTHTDLRPFACSLCDKSFNQDGNLQRHIILVHTNLKTVRCTWPDCTYTSAEKSKALRHIRTKHFKLPKTMKEQQEANIVDDRDPNVYVQMLTLEQITEQQQ